MDWVYEHAKAITGALTAFLTALAVALDTGGISAQEWITSLIALVVAGGAVFTIPNRTTEEAPVVKTPTTAKK